LSVAVSFQDRTPGVYRYKRPTQDYEPISHVFSRSQLSARAIKVGLYVLSHVDGFTQTQAQIAFVTRMAISTVRAALLDLEAAKHLVRHVVRDDGGRVAGTAYAITDVPFTDEDLVNLGSEPCTKSVHRDSVCTESTQPKKTRLRKKTTTTKKTNPSGGAPASAGPPAETPSHPQEEPMPTAVDEDFTLFAAPPKPKQKRKDRSEDPTARAVVAAFVDAYRLNHSGGDPQKRDVSRVGRDARALLDEGQAGVLELSTAATEMGGTQFSNLGMALKISRDRPKRNPHTRGMVPAKPNDHPHWAEVHERKQREQVQWVLRLQTEPELVEWVKEDPDEVRRLVAEHPQLAEVFGVAA